MLYLGNLYEMTISTKIASPWNKVHFVNYVFTEKFKSQVITTDCIQTDKKAIIDFKLEYFIRTKWYLKINPTLYNEHEYQGS